eukprot:TRINITY_DN28096_c0_g1_i6.p1 TRINITY_DN28096_c0_g1~~TRINITY_DN28096_c0_g1_i6.p1  ORF type:complete len:255 (-),score=22.44 TRINITY_DN28096_c0_g1_i6:133-897(-)
MQLTQCCQVFAYSEKNKRLKYRQMNTQNRNEPLYVEVQEDGSDAWRLDPVIDILNSGGVGIIPTDSYPALVCVLTSTAAVQRLYDIKDISPKKPLSILCKDFRDINKYTLGFPASNLPGQHDMFRLMKQVLPGPYTIILPASREMPKVVLDGSRHKTKSRKQVGIRLPNDNICQKILQCLDHPLLCTSAHVEEDEEIRTEIADAGVMIDMYPGIDFVVDVGLRFAEGSTIVDMTASEPQLLRQGKGDVSKFMMV